MKRRETKLRLQGLKRIAIYGLIMLFAVVQLSLVVGPMAANADDTPPGFAYIGEAGSATAVGLGMSVALDDPGSVSVGNHLIMRITMSANRTITITDPRGNDWQQDVLVQHGTGNNRTAVYSSKVETPYEVDDEIDISLSGETDVTMVAVVDEFSGLLAEDWFDVAASSGLEASNPASTAWDTGLTAETEQGKNLLFGVLGINAGSTTNVPSVVDPVWQNLGKHTVAAGVSRTTDAHYRQVTDQGQYSYAGTFNSTRTHGAAILVYKLMIPDVVPTMPQDLVVTPTHTSRVVVSWSDASNNETGFEILRAPDVAGTPGDFVVAGSVGTNETSFIDYDVEGETKYWYQVGAVNEAGTSILTPAVSGTTPDASSEGDLAIPVDTGFWMDKAELDAIPIVGEDPRVEWWGYMKDAADDEWPAPDMYTDGKHNIHTMAAALVFARLKPADGSIDAYADSLRAKVRAALEEVVDIPIDTNIENTRPSRFVATYVIAADLIRLKDYDPQFDDEFREWILDIIHAPFNTGGGAPSLYMQGYVRTTNTANMSRTTLAAAFSYLQDDEELANVALWTQGFAGEREVYNSWNYPGWDADPFPEDPEDTHGSHYWQVTPGDLESYYPVLPVGATKLDSNGQEVDMSGVVPSDWGRSGPFVGDDGVWPDAGPYDPPNVNVPYHWTTLRGIAPAVLILERAGFPATQWGDEALKRQMDANLRFAQLYPERGYTTTQDEISEWIPPLMNYLYDADYENNPVRTGDDAVRGQGENAGWTQWTHAGRILSSLPDQDGPTVSITSPESDDEVNGTVTVIVSATDNVGVEGVQIKLNGDNLGAEITSLPYELEWDTTLVEDGEYTLTAVARDAADNSTESDPVTVTVNNTDPADQDGPTVSITSPESDDEVNGTVTVIVSATDNVGVEGVQIKLNGDNLGAEITSLPYELEWDTTLVEDGEYTLTAVARDAADNSTESDPVTVTVNNVVTPPGGGGGGGGGTVKPPVVEPPVEPGDNPGLTPSELTRIKLINIDGTYYIIVGSKKYGVTIPGILHSYGLDFDDATNANSDELSWPITDILPPNDGALVKTLSDPTVYLISGQKKYGFVSEAVFLGLGFQFESVLVVTSPELNKLSFGGYLENPNARHMRGVLVNHNGTIYYIGAAARYPFPSIEVYNSWNIRNHFGFVVPANAADLLIPVGPVIDSRTKN